jgi:DedD protein
MSSLFDDTDDDLSLRTRRTEAAEYGEERAPSRQAAAHDREVTLNTGMVLAIFFALALVCAVFFGFGYSIGHKSGMAATAAADPSSAPPDTGSTADSGTSTSSGSKPSSGSPATPSIPGYEGKVASEKTPVAASTPAAAVDTATVAAEVDSALTSKPAQIVRTPPPAAAPSTAADGTASSYVQIAAVSHQEDADVLVSALQRRGYRVIQRSEPADKLIHVQIGPFTNRKDAEATKQKLLADGYNAFIK